jgi:hypothetical protein
MAAVCAGFMHNMQSFLIIFVFIDKKKKKKKKKEEDLVFHSLGLG